MLSSLHTFLEQAGTTDDEQTPSTPLISVRALRLSAEDSVMRPYSPHYPIGRPSYTDTRSRISLNPLYFPERVAEEISSRHYLDPSARENYRVTTTVGKFKSNSNSLLNYPALYVLLPDNRLYACSFMPNMHHSYLCEGFDVKGAGNLFFHNGRLITVSNESGHYRPTLSQMLPALDWFLQESEHHSILFEDHSENNPDLALNGIKHYKVSRHDTGELNLRLLTDDMLLAYLQLQIQEISATIRSSSTTSSIIVSTLDDDEEWMGSEYSSEELGPMPSPSTSAAIEPAPEPRHLLLNYPMLARLTCIQSFYNRQEHNALNPHNRQPLSRAWGVRNVQRRPRSGTI